MRENGIHSNYSTLIEINGFNMFKNELKKKVSQFGDINFESNIWYCEKLKLHSSYLSDYTLKFKSNDESKNELLKFYALLLDNRITTIKTKIKYVNDFFKYLNSYFPNVKISDINKRIISQYEEYLRSLPNQESFSRMNYEAVRQFFILLGDFPELPKINPMKFKNPFVEKTVKNPAKYIPEKVIKELDIIMFDKSNNIPIFLRLAYWLQRSFPNRISEVSNIKTSALKALYSYYVLSVPTTKQNGGYIREEFKTIPIINSGHGKFIIDLIEDSKVARDELMACLPFTKEHEDILLLFPAFNFTNNRFEELSINSFALKYKSIREIIIENPNLSIDSYHELLKEKDMSISKETIKRILNNQFKDDSLLLRPLSGSRFNKALQYLVKQYNILDDDDNLFHISSHQFRHNATTDRLYIGEYTFDQMRVLRNDKGKKMVMQYAHQQKEMHKQDWLNITGLTPPSEAPVAFKGIIQNLKDERLLNRLLKREGAYLTWEANGKKGVGICSNIIACNPKGTSVHFECYECDWFIPKAEYLSDYEKECAYWTEIMEKSAGLPNRAATFDNAIRNINCLERIIKICKKGIASNEVKNGL